MRCNAKNCLVSELNKSGISIFLIIVINVSIEHCGEMHGSRDITENIKIYYFTYLDLDPTTLIEYFYRYYSGVISYFM